MPSATGRFVIIGPDTFGKRSGDLLRHNRIDVLGPGKALARIETSKSFAPDLPLRYNPSSLPCLFHRRHNLGSSAFLATLGQHYVIKADGLTGGKGVKVAQDHLRNQREALDYWRELLETQGSAA